MREAKITSDREKCRDLLNYMIPEFSFSGSIGWDAKWLSEQIEIDEAECQEILDELVSAKLVKVSSQHYFLTDEILVTWQQACWQV